jgi:homoserine O-succinyltransferase
MPVRIPDTLPAAKTLAEENIFVMTQKRSIEQEIRPLRIAVLNLMPTKIATETQLLRLLGNTSLQVDPVLLHTASYESQNIDPQHLNEFYRTFDEIKDERFDGLIITGAPVEMLSFEEVTYWNELVRIMKWAENHVFSTMYICWAAQAGLYYHYNIQKHALKAKRFGVFKNHVLNSRSRLMRGLDDEFNVPHSRHTEIYAEDVLKHDELELLAVSEEAGPSVIASRDGRQVFLMGHSEYDQMTLANEYFRDVNKGLPIDKPKHYFPNDDTSAMPRVTWRSAANLLFGNWLNYYVYQETPYDLNVLTSIERKK